MTWCSWPVAALLLATACGGSDTGSGGGVTGRLMSVDGARVCASPDRGETQTCVDVADPATDLDGVDVGSCVELDAATDRVEVVDEAACAAGDLGD